MMRRGLAICLLALGGCAAPKPDAPPPLSTEAQVQALFEQKYIDPLTRYLEQHGQDQALAQTVEKVRQERDRRCNEIARLYASRARSQDNLKKLEKGYRYSCPRMVEDFAALVNASDNTADAPSSAGDTGENPAAQCHRLFSAKNYAQALSACNEPASQGDARAQYQLGVMYRLLGAYPEAMKWTRLAVEQGMAEAQYHLGLLYYNGQGAAKNPGEALAWFQRAGEQGVAEAQYSAGRMYYQGEGVSRDDPAAARWFERAAQQGWAEAQMYLGRMYANGEGVAQDGAVAKKWFLLAAKQGEAEAQYNLGAMYAGGKALPRDYQEAYVWFSLAVIGGHRQSLILRDMVGKELSVAQLTEAQRRVSQWRAPAKR